jgi:hypothetical protein
MSLGKRVLLLLNMPEAKRAMMAHYDKIIDRILAAREDEAKG